jgi:predicted HicB family RNase H-like nuclease
MARPPKYTTDTDKPVSVSLRIPRDLYDQAQHHAQMRRTTLTELIVEGLRMRLETPTDPRDILASQDITAMQELKQMIAAEVHAILAAQRQPIADPAPETSAPPEPTLSHGKNNTVIQEKASRDRHKLTPRQVRALRDKHLRGVPVPALLEEYDISRASLFRYLQSDKR